MRVCVYGLGAVGGFIAGRLAGTGVEVSAIARGATLEALTTRGLVLQENGTSASHRVHANDDPAALGTQDVVILAVKAPALPAVVERTAPLIGPDTVVLTAMNGIPWWFTAALPGEAAQLHLESVDPGGRLAAAIPTSSVLGSVLHLNAASPQPGVIHHGSGQRIIVGEVTGELTERLADVAALLTTGSFEVEQSDKIHAEVWFKLWGNMTMNPISAITGATLDRILDDPYVRTFATRCMLEAAAVGDRIGLRIEVSPEDRHTVTRELGAVRTSMLQDVQGGRPVELDALVSAVVELANALHVPVPNIETLLGLARLHARVLGLYPEAT